MWLSHVGYLVGTKDVHLQEHPMVHCSTRACAEGCDGGPGQSGIVSRVIVGKQQAAATLSVGKKFMSQWAGNETVYTFQGDKVRWLHTHLIRGMFI